MSGFFGIFNRNGKVVKEKTVNTMLDTMSSWNPDDKGTYINGSVALGHAMLWNSPESKYEHLPLKDDVYILTMDARIDNRDKLVKEIELPNRPLSEIGDSEFILGAYKKWGEECPKYLLGDFSFAIWDEKKQQLFCARDHVGIKPFYYHLDDEKFVFSNDIRSLLEYEDINNKYNDQAISLYIMTSDIMHNEWTFYQDIIKLPPATTMTIVYGKIYIVNYWNIENSPHIHYNTIEEYADTLFKLVEASVQARSRSVYPIASHLSGGLDSSSIAVIAARGLKYKNRKLLTYNWIHKACKDDNTEDIEWAYSRKIVDKEKNIIHKHVNLSIQEYIEFFEKHNVTYGDTSQLWSEIAVRKAAENEGVRTMLSGWGGDELITYNGTAYYRELLLRTALFKVLTTIWKDVKESHFPLYNFMKIIFYKIVAPMLPNVLAYKIANFYRLKKKFPYYTNEIFKNNIECNKIPVSNTMTVPTKLELYNYGHIHRRIESWAVSGMEKRIEYCYPLLDKRIVEFAVGIPPELFLKKGISRYLFKLSMNKVLPEEVRCNVLKVEPSHSKKIFNDVTEACSVWKDKITKKLQISDIYYININKLLWMLECGEKKSCYKCNKNYLKGNTKIIDIVQGILLYNSIKRNEIYENTKSENLEEADFK